MVVVLDLVSIIFIRGEIILWLPVYYGLYNVLVFYVNKSIILYYRYSSNEYLILIVIMSLG